MRDSPGYDSPRRLFQKIWITLRNLNRNRKYFNPLLSGPARLELWKDKSKILLDCHMIPRMQYVRYCGEIDSPTQHSILLRKIWKVCFRVVVEIFNRISMRNQNFGKNVMPVLLKWQMGIKGVKILSYFPFKFYVFSKKYLFIICFRGIKTKSKQLRECYSILLRSS